MTNKEEKSWTVYVHKNKQNGKCYVGITSKKPEYRWQQGEGYKKQFFYKMIQKYGWDGFEHIIIASNLTQKEAQQMEIDLIGKLESHISKNGYNISFGGEGYLGADNHGENNPMYGKHHSQETRLKISKRLKGVLSGEKHPFYGKTFSEETKRKMKENRKYPHKKLVKASMLVTCKPVLQYDKNFHFVKEYESESEAERETKISRHTISSCCLHQIKTAGNYIWIFKDDLDFINYIKNIDNYFDCINVELCGKKIYQFDTNLKYLSEYKSLRDAERQTGISHNNIADCCRGILKTSGGYVWRFKDDLKDIESFSSTSINFSRDGNDVFQFDLNGNFIKRYISVAEAARETGNKRTNVSKACRGLCKTSGGYIWRYKEDVKESENNSGSFCLL